MKIGNLTAKSPVFGRALCKSEENELKHLTKKALDELKISIGTTFFDFTIPDGEFETPIGTMFSPAGISTAEFANTYFGTTNIQLGPQGQISNSIRSPYSSSVFALGMQTISPERLATPEYGKLLTRKELRESPYTSYENDNNKVDYEYLFDEEYGIKPLLVKAFKRFEKLPEESKLKQEFATFKEENKDWLERDSVFETIAYEYGTDDTSQWNERERNIYADENHIDKDLIEHYKNVTRDSEFDAYRFNEFVQFIAAKQQQQTKEELNARGIKLTGDAQIGFSNKDVWAYKSAFYKDGRMYGCKDDLKNIITCWTQAPDMSKLDGETGELFRKKFEMQFKRYNAIRIDAAWQLIAPTIVYSTGCKDEYENLLGTLTGLEDQQPYLGTKIINILKDEAKKANIPENNISLELLDGDGKSWRSLSDPSVKTAVKNMYCIHTMRHMHTNTGPYDKGTWGFPGHYRSNNAEVFKHPFEISIGTHDDISAIEFAKSMDENQTSTIARELNNNTGFFSSLQNRVSGLFAMLFTNTPNNESPEPGKVGMTITDAVGSERRINIPNTKKGNWEFRLGEGWEENYFENLSKGLGFNLPKTLSTALRLKDSNSKLADELDKYTNALSSSDGPMTREKAQRMANYGTLNRIA